MKKYTLGILQHRLWKQKYSREIFVELSAGRFKLKCDGRLTVGTEHTDIGYM